MSDAASNPSAFTPRSVLALVLFGGLAFVVALYGMSAATGGSANDGNAHAGGKGLNGFAGLVALLEADGFVVGKVRDPAGLAQPGLLVLTPPADADGAKLGKIVFARRAIGPTMIIAPKWLAAKPQSLTAKRGWVVLAGTAAPQWKGFHDEIGVALGKPGNAAARNWHASAFSGALPQAEAVESGSGNGLVPLVTSGDGRPLAALVNDPGKYDALYDFGGLPHGIGGDDGALFPVVLVFEPDLLNNWGLADQRTALMARALVVATGGNKRVPVLFDQTLNGYGHTRSLVDLAFRPPYLAATLCLLLAALATGWRAFVRFGPPRLRARSIALGKTALVDNSAGLIRRAGRLRLVAAPYATMMQERIALALRLPRGLDPAATEAAIDAAQAQCAPTLPAFSQTAESLRAARGPHDLARHAAALQTIEKALT
ncbi:MAG: DUF4350 domain-containing protein [Novosphingobium sp.]|nr:DUF4350 domain-containing protein [Novosphingobium sp.]